MDTITSSSTESIYLSSDFRTFSDSHTSSDHARLYEYRIENNDLPAMTKKMVGGSNCISGILTASIVDSCFDQNFLKSAEKKRNIIDLNNMCMYLEHCSNGGNSQDPYYAIRNFQDNAISKSKTARSSKVS